MKVEQASDVLKRFASMTERNGNPKSAEILRNFAALIGTQGNKTVKAFVKETKKRQSHRYSSRFVS